MARKRVYEVGTVWENRYGNLIITEYLNKNKVKVKFINTGKEKFTNTKAIKLGNVKDLFHPTVCGVGMLGNTTSSICGEVKRSYHTWRDMIRRCYDPNAKASRGYYELTSICRDWLCFEVFELWYDTHYIEGYELDKDLTVLGNKEYSPDFCCFVPSHINSLIGKNVYNENFTYSELPVGVSYHSRDKCYTAQCYVGGKLEHLGYHDNIIAARLAYIKCKEDHIYQVATKAFENKEISECVYNNLINYLP